jgi:hypothetical protein
LAGKSTRKKSIAERFLSAPEEVVKNPRELAKLKDRKARDEARIERERVGKAKGRPSLEDILADVVRVAEDEDTNPWHEFRAISRRRYELYGHFPVEFLLEHGRFEHVKQMAGLAQTTGDRALLAARTEKSQKAHDARYARRWLLPHVDKFPELSRAASGSRLALAIGDTHSLLMDPAAWLSALAFAEDAQPDAVLWVGDHVDGSEISRHPKVPGFTVPLQEELDAQRGAMREMREACPGSRFVLVPDNHFWKRMVSYLTQVAPALANLRSMRIDELMDLQGLDVELAPSGSFLAPGEDQRPALRLWDRLLVTHGTRLGAHPAHGELASWGQSGVSGHVHRHQLAMGATFALRDEQWMTLPGGVIDQAARHYVEGPNPAWSRGWGLVEVHGGALQLTPVPVQGGVAMAQGWRYEATGRLPEGLQETREFWRKRWGIGK